MDRVLFIDARAQYPWRGPCLRVGHDVDALTRLGYEVDLLTLPVGLLPAVPGVRTLTIPRLPFCRNLPEGPSIRKFLLDLLLLTRAVALALRNRYAVVHGVDDAGILAWLAGRLSRTAVVFEQHDDRFRGRLRWWRRPAASIYWAAERFVLRRADAVIAIDPGITADLRAVGREGRACLIADIPALLEPVDPDARAAAHARLIARADQILVTYTGSLARFQGLDLLFNAMPHVLQGDARVRFVIVGGNPVEIERQRQVLLQAGLEAAVTFLGRIPAHELAAVLAASDILVAPRLSGNCPPMKVLDYLQSGAAIVATDCDANRAVLTTEVAVLTPPRAEALADGILRLSRDPARRAELGRRGQELIRSSYSFEIFQDSLRRCYEYVRARR
jgi:glycosyltransferase involved in cell wall biosynthesis